MFSNPLHRETLRMVVLILSKPCLPFHVHLLIAGYNTLTIV